MRKALFGVFLTLFCAVAAKAQAPYKVEVVTSGATTPVVSELETRISATTRYTLTSSPPARFLLIVVCMKNRSAGGVVIGYVCGLQATYIPAGKYAVFPRWVPAGIVECSVVAPSYCAESMFDHFVKSTRHNKVKKYDDTAHREWTAIYDLAYVRGARAGEEIASASCKAANAQKKPQKVKKP